MVNLILTLISILPLTSLAMAADAPQIHNNPKNVLARAHLDTGKTKGIIEFSAKNGTVFVHLDTTGLPQTGGPFYYHIHNNAVAPGACNKAGTHLNPYGATYGKCDDLDDDSMCQVGDLSGKHGYINTTCFETTYYDPYLSLNPKSKSYVVGRSVVLHYANMDPFACGTIEMTKEKVKRDQDLNLDGSQGWSNETYTNSTQQNWSSETEEDSQDEEWPASGVESTYVGSGAITTGNFIGVILACLAAIF